MLCICIRILNAVPLKQWIWLCYLYYSNFYAIPILQCLWLFLSPFSPTCTFTVQFNFPHIATNYCPMYFPLKIVLCNYLNLGKAVLRPPFQASLSGSTWHRVCLYLNLLLRWSHYRLDVYTLPLCQAFICIASARLPLLGFSLYLPPLGIFVMLSVGWQCSLVVCVAPGAFLKAVYAGYHGYACSWSLGYAGYALPEAWVCWVYWGDCRGSLLAVG